MPQPQMTVKYFGCPLLQWGQTGGREQLMALAFIACQPQKIAPALPEEHIRRPILWIQGPSVLKMW